MKISSITIFLFLLAWCFGWRQGAAQSSEQAKAPLTVGQAEPIAMRLANKKFGETYSNYSGGVFNTNVPNNYFGGTQVSTNFVNGRWIFKFYRRTTHDSCSATVELASDGSTNLVTVKRQGGLP